MFDVEGLELGIKGVGQLSMFSVEGLELGIKGVGQLSMFSVEGLGFRATLDMCGEFRACHEPKVPVALNDSHLKRLVNIRPNQKDST